MQHGWKLLNYDLDTGANNGDETITIELDPLDLARVKWLDIVVTMTTLDAAGDDTCDFFFEETHDGTNWDQRWHSHQFTGAMSPTEIRRYRIYADYVPDATDLSYETTGSAGGSDLTAGTVRPGPFAGKLHATSAPYTLQTTHRVRIVIDDDDSDARFAGNLLITAYTDV